MEAPYTRIHVVDHSQRHRRCRRRGRELPSERQVVFTSTSAPYQFNLLVPTNISSLKLGATAVDLGGNVGTAPSVSVNVIPDPGTTVTESLWT